MTTSNVHRIVWLSAGAVLCIDQLTKFAGTSNFGGVFEPVGNPDYSLGVVTAPTVTLIALSAVTLIAAALYGIGLARAGRIPAWIPGVILGGAASNLADRVTLGEVRDFIPTSIAIFNVADLAVLGGVIAFMWCMTSRACST